MASDLSTLSAKKLAAVIERTNKRWGECLDATIAAGMGDFRFADIVEAAKGSSLCSRANVARDYLNARLDRLAALDELDRRMKWHGSDKPIRKPKTN